MVVWGLVDMDVIVHGSRVVEVMLFGSRSLCFPVELLLLLFSSETLQRY